MFLIINYIPQSLLAGKSGQICTAFSLTTFHEIDRQRVALKIISRNLFIKLYYLEQETERKRLKVFTTLVI